MTCKVRRLEAGALKRWRAEQESSGGTDLYNFPLIEADLTDGTWTLLDPDSLVKSVAFASGRNVITMNALSSGSANYNWKTSSAKREPRWYKTAKIGNNNLNREDLTQCIYKMDFDNTRDMSCEIVTGLAKTATGLTVADLSLGGAIGQVTHVDDSNALYGVYAYSAATLLGTGGPEKGFISFLYGADRVGGGVAVLLDSDALSENSGIDRSNNNAVSGGGQPLSHVIGIGARQSNTVWAEDVQVKISIKYSFIRASLS